MIRRALVTVGFGVAAGVLLVAAVGYLILPRVEDITIAVDAPMLHLHKRIL